jgi:hypothetical protein
MKPTDPELQCLEILERIETEKKSEMLIADPPKLSDNGTKCDKCGASIQVGQWPFCPHEAYGGGIVGDECDVLIHHGLCWPDGTPRRFRSKSEIKQLAFEKGLFQGGDTPKINQRLQEARAKARESNS